MPTESEEKSHTVAWTIGGAITFVFLVAGAATLMTRAGLEPSEVSTHLGLAVSILGLIAAVAIFIRQGKSAQNHHDHLLEVLAGNLPKEDANADNEPDRYEAESEAVARISEKYDGWLVMSHGQVPLRLVRDLVDYWDSEGHTGSWSLSTIRAALRQKGRGNYSWYIVTVDPEQKKQRTWKVSRGGHGKEGVTVTLFDERPAKAVRR